MKNKKSGRAGGARRGKRPNSGASKRQASGRGAEAPQTQRSDAVQPKGEAEGVVSAHRAGYGFVRVQGMTESVFLPPGQMSGVLHGDRIRLEIKRERDGRYSGRVTDLVERGTKALLGTIEFEGRAAFVNSADRRIGLRCQIAPADLNDARRGDWVIARITTYPKPGVAGRAVVVRRLDPDNSVEMATESAIAKVGLPVDFPPAALVEAEAFGARVAAAESARRVDLRPLPLVTIDGADARDFDDAVYAERQPDGFRLIVAIADVSHYVRPGTALDDEARERGTSVYFPSRVIPMLPTALSNQLCSLEPHVDRLCMAADMRVSKQGALLEARFYPAVMRSAARLTYDKAYAALFEGRADAVRELGDLREQLLPLVDLYRALVKARGRRGALDFDAPEPTFDLDDRGRVRAVHRYSRNDAHKLIEECMILANVAVARELQGSKSPTLFRVHGEPDPEKLDQLLATLNALGVAAEIPQSVTSRALRQITHRLGSAPERPFIESLVIRSMPQAVYQSANIGHFGLALQQYAHFTSPIRRYPDLVVHRTLKARLGIAPPAGVAYRTEELGPMGEALTRLEKRADEADRYVDQFLKCSYLRERIGQTFEGLITSVVDFGCFVQILEVSADGLLHLDALRDDEYKLDDGGYAWVGQRSRRKLQLGSKVKVIVTGANPIEGLIDLTLAELE